jgi:hypothetical protein
VPKEIFCKDVIIQAQKNAWMTSELMKDCLDVYVNVSLVCHQSHGVCLQWMHFMASSPRESEIA